MTKIFWRLLLCMGMISFAVCLYGQEAQSFQQLSKKQGLSQVSVFAIAQDSSGFMWFGTRNGLNKFDGYQFKVYKKDSTDNSLVADDIRHLYSDPLTHNLWIGTIHGLGRYETQTDRFVNYLNVPSDSTSISSNIIRQVFRDSRQRLWVGTTVGLNLYQSEPDNFKRFYIKDTINTSVTNKEVKVIFEDSDHQLWLGTNNGLYKLLENDTGRHRFERVDNSGYFQLSDPHIKSIVEDQNDNLWIGTENGGLNYWDRTKKKITIYKSSISNPNSLSHNSIRSMVMDHNNDLWIGTFEGLNLLKGDEATFKIFETEDFQSTGLSDKSIHSLFVDKSGSLWIGTYYGGVNHWVENYNQFNNFKNIPTKNSLSGNIVSSFAEDEKSNLWIGTEGGGLNYFDKEKNQFEHFQYQAGKENTLSANNIKQLLLDGDQLWIGTFQGGLNLLDIKSKVFKQFKNDPSNKNSLSNNNVYGLHKKGNLLWILTYGQGLDVLDLSTNQYHNFSENIKDSTSISSNLARVVLETKEGQIWIGTERGLNKVYRGADGFPAKFKTYLPKEQIYSIQESSDQKIWVGTFTNGLYFFNPKDGTAEQFTTADGLSGNSIFGIVEISNEEVWLSTNNGITKFNFKEKSFTNYDYSNGLANLEHNFNAYYKTRSGNILFGGIHGFTVFDPQQIQPNTYIPPIVFTELRQNNELVHPKDENSGLSKDINQVERIEFDYHEANFSISFAALDYFSPENNRYAYMLEGVDKDWNYTVGKTEVTYGIQREGTYTFRLRGANSDGIWNPHERKLQIKVLPPLYRTWWAYLLYLVCICMAVYGLVRFIRLQHKLQLEQIAKQKQEELHEMKLRFFTNITHEFRTPLTLIVGPIKDLLSKQKLQPEVNKQLSLVEKNTQRLLNLVNQLITFRKLATDHEPLEIVHKNIITFLQEIFLSFQELAREKNIDYQFQADDDGLLLYFDEDKLEKVFFNLLSNAFKFTPDNGQIVLEVSASDDLVNIKVQDSGIGIAPELQDQIFKRFYEKNTAQVSSIKGSGIGLAISKQMVELHSGKIMVLPNSTPEKSGANFLVQLPRGKSHFISDKKIEHLTIPAPIKEKRLYPPVETIKNDPQIHDNNADQPAEKDLPLLLIIEDNPEIRTYIQQVFIQEYRFAMAENGKEGLEKARKEMPDLIISDVMMPEMDGITLSGLLKTDIETSHIPIILLTARTASMFKIEGLQTGVDDYLTKPFDPEELRLKVRNIVRTREAIKEKFARVFNFDPKEINITSADEKLLQKAMEIVEKHIGDYEFNVNQFAAELAVSRPLLFTKLKALTGQTPNNFIKTIRLKRAAQILKAQKLNVSQTAYKVGFKDPKYFRKCFKKQFDTLPSEYSK